MTQDEIKAIIDLFPCGIAQEDIRQHIDLHESTISKQCRKLERYNEVHYVIDEKQKVWFPKNL